MLYLDTFSYIQMHFLYFLYLSGLLETFHFHK